MDEIEQKNDGRRSVRRHHKNRMKQKARRISKIQAWYAGFDNMAKEREMCLVKQADHLKSCSCSMCCNPRRSGWSPRKGKTLQEQNQDIKDS